jgi:peptidoglycan hydrolase-like protein with peptidoglycan-binding domain
VTDLHSPGWVDEVSKPGPNGIRFANEPEVPEVQHVGVATFIMEDDTDTSLFTPGCAAYAGYVHSSFDNMTAVKAYAVAQKAMFFAYTPTAAETSGADALDIEPGDASPGDAPAAYRKGIRYFYGSASWISSITAALAGAGIARNQYRIISAHYIGAHICGPATCGYPQADATQFTSRYLGRSLDATLCPADFFGHPAPQFPVVVYETGPTVLAIQRNLNRWATVIGLRNQLATDGIFGTATLWAVKLAQHHFGEQATGSVTRALYDKLAGPLPVNPASWVLPRVVGLKLLADGAHSLRVSFTNGEGHSLPQPVGRYELAISEGNSTLNRVIDGYPRYRPSASGVVTWQEGGLKPGTAYIAGIREQTARGDHSSEWATVNFKTPAA